MVSAPGSFEYAGPKSLLRLFQIGRNSFLFRFQNGRNTCPNFALLPA